MSQLLWENLTEQQTGVTWNLSMSLLLSVATLLKLHYSTATCSVSHSSSCSVICNSNNHNNKATCRGSDRWQLSGAKFILVDSFCLVQFWLANENLFIWVWQEVTNQHRQWRRGLLKSERGRKQRRDWKIWQWKSGLFLYEEPQHFCWTTEDKRDFKATLCSNLLYLLLQLFSFCLMES